ncbi:MAG: hypothetical protein Q9204_005919 [Flavoplaca sp. TL-2023a]
MPDIVGHSVPRDADSKPKLLNSLPDVVQALSLAEKFAFRQQKPDGHWCAEFLAQFGYLLAFQCAVTALLLEGFTFDDTPVRRGLAAMETWTLEDDAEGKRIQSTTSPIWDTALMLEGLCGAGIPRDDDRLRRGADWLKERQLFGPLNDVALYCPDMRTGGGWAFQYDTRCSLLSSLVLKDKAK